MLLLAVDWELFKSGGAEHRWNVQQIQKDLSSSVIEAGRFA